MPSRTAAGDGAWSFWLDVHGGTVSREPDGSLAVRDLAGAVAMRLPIPYITDSAGVPGVREPADVNGTYEVGAHNGRTLVTVKVPLPWLDDPARVWPVRVDPTVERAGYDSTKNYKSDGTFVDGGPMRIGSPNDAGKMGSPVVPVGAG